LSLHSDPLITDPTDKWEEKKCRSFFHVWERGGGSIVVLELGPGGSERERGT